MTISEIYLSIPGITGDVTTAGYAGQIAVQSVVWEMAVPLNPSTGIAAGNVNSPVFTFQALSGSHSPLLWNALATQQSLSNTSEVVVSYVVSKSDRLVTFVSLSLGGCYCGSYSPACDTFAAGPTATFTIQAESVTYKVAQFKKDNSVGGYVTASWPKRA